MDKEPTREQSLEQEIEDRIKIMESDSYKKVPGINKYDVIGMAGTGIICIAGLVWGLL